MKGFTQKLVGLGQGTDRHVPSKTGIGYGQTLFKVRGIRRNGLTAGFEEAFYHAAAQWAERCVRVVTQADNLHEHTNLVLGHFLGISMRTIHNDGRPDPRLLEQGHRVLNRIPVIIGTLLSTPDNEMTVGISERLQDTGRPSRVMPIKD